MNFPIVPVLLSLAAISVPVSAPLPPRETAAPPVAEAVGAEASAAPAIPAQPRRNSPMLNHNGLDTQRGGQALVISNQRMKWVASGRSSRSAIPQARSR